MYNTKYDIIEWLNYYSIVDYTINDDLTVDVDGNVWLYNNR